MESNHRGSASLATPIAVLDTSVLMSSFRHQLWLLASDGFYTGVWSTIIVAELVRVRVRTAIRQGVAPAIYRQRINNLVHQLSDVLIVAPYRTIQMAGVLGDADDEPILATALAGSAAYIVSLNTRHFPAGGERLGIHFLTPSDFVTLLDRLYPAAGIRQRADEAGRQLP